MSQTDLIYGVQPVVEALRARRRRCRDIFLVSGRREQDIAAVVAEAVRSGLRPQEISREEMTRLVGGSLHQGVAARVEPYPYADLETVLKVAKGDPRGGLLLILDGITDPQNLGALVRTAHLMGVHGLMLPRDNSASVTPTVVKASAGATEYMNIIQVTNITRTIDDLKKDGYWVVGASGTGGMSIYQYDFKGNPVAIVMGSEGEGLRRLVREKCDHLLYIPMEGRIDSYNVSVAGALFLGEAVRQRSEFSSKNRTESAQNP